MNCIKRLMLYRNSNNGIEKKNGLTFQLNRSFSVCTLYNIIYFNHKAVFKVK